MPAHQSKILEHFAHLLFNPSGLSPQMEASAVNSSKLELENGKLQPDRKSIVFLRSSLPKAANLHFCFRTKTALGRNQLYREEQVILQKNLLSYTLEESQGVELRQKLSGKLMLKDLHLQVIDEIQVKKTHEDMRYISAYSDASVLLPYARQIFIQCLQGICKVFLAAYAELPAELQQNYALEIIEQLSTGDKILVDTQYPARDKLTDKQSEILELFLADRHE